jgi:glycosyltransferase involved in cell wall biosynthesis
MIANTPPNRRKFLFYTHAFVGGGAERVWALLASEFARKGHDVIVAVDFDAQENRGFLAPGIRVETLGGGHAAHVLKLARLIRGERPDVTLSAIGVSNLKHMLAALLAMQMRRTLISFHGFFASEPQRLSRWGNNLTWLFSRLCGRAVAVSDGLRDDLVAGHGADPRRTVRIHNPVEMPGSTVARSEADLLARAPVALFLGRFVADKDIPMLLDAFSRVELPGARLVLAGNGPLRAGIEARIAAPDLAGRVSLPGYVNDPEPLFAEARCVVLSSLRESFGNVVVEAMARGLAVVSTDAAGPAEILENGRFGAVTPRGEVDALAAALRAALAAPGDPTQRIERAQDFALPVVAQRYLALCEEIIREA